MVMALGVIAEAKTRARAGGREEMIQAMKKAGFSEADIQKAVDNLNTGSNGRKQS